MTLPKNTLLATLILSSAFFGASGCEQGTTQASTPTATKVPTPTKKPHRAAIPEVHPLIFSMVNCDLSDTESPIVTEINLDAVAIDRNQFDWDAVHQEDKVWTTYTPALDNPNGRAYMSYKILAAKDGRYKILFCDCGGGTLISQTEFDFSILTRKVQLNGKTVNIRVLKIEGVKYV